MSKCLQVHSEHYMKSHIQITLHKAEPIPGVQEMAASVDEHECANKYEFSTMESVQAFHLVYLQGIPFKFDQLRSVDDLSHHLMVKCQPSMPTHQLP